MPSDSVAKRATPRSTPTMERERWTGGLTAKLGQEDAAVALLQLDLRGVRITETFAASLLAQVLLTPPQPLFLERERLVVEEAAGTCEAAHEPALCNRWHQLVLEGLPAFHGQGSRRSEPSRPHPKITRTTPESHPFEA